MRFIEQIGRSFARLPRRAKIAIAMGADLTALPLVLCLAVMLRRGSISHAFELSPWLYAAAGLISVGVLAQLGTYRVVFRYVSRDALLSSGFGMVVAAVLLYVTERLVIRSGIALHGIAIYIAFALLYVLASRLAVRELIRFRRGAKQRVAIYGAGEAGAQLVGSLNQSGLYVPVAFVDADSSLRGKIVAGIKVYGPDQLEWLVGREGISSVLLAVPSCSLRQRQAILKSLEPLPVHVRTVPGIADIVAGHASVADVKEVDADDLLGRDPVAPNEALLDGCIRGKSVMVSGAGGSIGSELCRQIVRLRPKQLVLLEMSESALYQIDRELRTIAAAQKIDAQVVALLGNAHHRNRMREIMHRYGVQTVYHAAAYKHVPIVEHNMIEGIHNNVFSTWYAAEAALECRVETFVLISTDKAVNPTNVMGTTKRLAELTLQALQDRSTHTRFCMVRFGNVLESSGSVVPLFREQITRGGPVTVTHKDIIRYFMTIPEASQLVLQAGSMARGGDVFVLDMGEPVRIEDLAKRMIRLMGLTVRDESNPEGDIQIVYTGLRPAEKLYEELLIGSNVTQTEHPMIMRAMEEHLPWPRLRILLEELLFAIDEFDCARARVLLTQGVHEYRPVSGIQDLVWLHGHEESAVVTDIRTRQPRLEAVR